MPASFPRPGPAGPSGASYVHTQSSAASVWTVTHDMGSFPGVTVVNDTGDEVLADVTYIDNTTVRVTLIQAMTGKAYLS